ncbi:hypothetical protein TNCV_503131 [Trichonephila clavipes]|nr:hypothetical protein TNCV_503131 [Trichonephila clavipes]
MRDVGPSTLQSGHVALRFPCVLSTEETPKREALQFGRPTQGHYEGLCLFTATGILGTRNPAAYSSVGSLCSGLTATAGSDVVQYRRPIFDDFFQHLWPYIGINAANVVFQMVKRLWLIRIDQ